MGLKKQLEAAIRRNDTAEVTRIKARLEQRNARWQRAKGFILPVITGIASKFDFGVSRAVVNVGSALGMNRDRLEGEMKNFNSMKMIFNKSWRTTGAGILAIVGGIVHLVFEIRATHTITEGAIMTCATAVVTGLGLIVARDNSVTSEQAGCIDCEQ